MNQPSHEDDSHCPPLGTIMALLDGQLEGRGRSEAEAHLQACERCRQLAAELRDTDRAVERELSCLDDEGIAAYVEHRLRRRRGTLARSQVVRVRRHLARCDRCREQVALLTAACRAGVGPIGRLLGLLSGGDRAWQPAVRWASLAAAAVLAVLAVCLLATRSGPRSHPLPVTRQPRVAHARPGAEPVQPPRTASHLEAARAPAIVSRPPSLAQRPESSGKGVPRPTGKLAPPRPEAALVPPGEKPETTLPAALAALALTEKSGKEAERARAALQVASLYHQQAKYELAARYYGQAAAAADKGGQRALKADALILLGASLAELGEVQKARQQFAAALKLSREIGYAKGEQNALIQLQLLGEDAGQGIGE